MYIYIYIHIFIILQIYTNDKCQDSNQQKDKSTIIAVDITKGGALSSARRSGRYTPGCQGKGEAPQKPRPEDQISIQRQKDNEMMEIHINLQGGPLPVIDLGITPINGLING